MRSYLLSILAKKFGPQDEPAFAKTHAHHWLVWEPGTWTPPGRSATLIITKKPESLQEKAGEALALALQPKVGQTELTLGRGDTCDILINDGTLSAIHLVFAPHGAGWAVKDAHSTNGSWVNGVSIKDSGALPVSNGMRIQAAQVAFTYYTPAGLFARLRQGS